MACRTPFLLFKKESVDSTTPSGGDFMTTRIKSRITESGRIVVRLLVNRLTTIANLGINRRSALTSVSMCNTYLL